MARVYIISKTNKNKKDNNKKDKKQNTINVKELHEQLAQVDTILNDFLKKNKGKSIQNFFKNWMASNEKKQVRKTLQEIVSFLCQHYRIKRFPIYLSNRYKVNPDKLASVFMKTEKVPASITLHVFVSSEFLEFNQKATNLKVRTLKDLLLGLVQGFGGILVARKDIENEVKAVEDVKQTLLKGLKIKI